MSIYSTIINSFELNKQIYNKIFKNKSKKFQNFILKHEDILITEYYICNDDIDNNNLNDINNNNDIDNNNNDIDNNNNNDINNNNNLNDIDDNNNNDNLNDIDINNNINNNNNNNNNINNIDNLNNNNIDIINNNIINYNIIEPNKKYMLIDLNQYNQLFKFTFSSQHLGVIGENHIYEILCSLNYNPINTSKIAHVGDIHLKFDNFILMFEIKNKLKITKDDITKFKSDIETLKQTHGNVCGCFISLCERLPFKFNIHETYMTNPNKYILQTYIESLKLIFQSNNNLIFIQNQLNNQLINYSSEIKTIDKHIKYSEELNKDMIDLKKSLSTKLNTLISILKGLDPNLENIYNLRNDLKNYINNKSKWTIKECENIIRKYDIELIMKTKQDIIKFINNEL